MIIEYRTDLERRLTSRDRRRLLREAGRCINGPLEGSRSRRTGIEHGPVVRGGRCARCVAVYEATS